MTPGLRHGWQAVTALSFLLCLLVAWQAWKLSLVDRLGPGPGFFPFYLALIGTVLSAVIFVHATRTAAAPADDAPDGTVFPHERDAVLRLVAIIGVTAVAAGLMEPLGFRLAMLVFVVALLLGLGARRWWVIALVALAASFGVFQVFNNWLDVILPQGPVDSLLGI